MDVDQLGDGRKRWKRAEDPAASSVDPPSFSFPPSSRSISLHLFLHAPGTPGRNGKHMEPCRASDLSLQSELWLSSLALAMLSPRWVEFRMLPCCPLVARVGSSSRKAA